MVSKQHGGVHELFDGQPINKVGSPPSLQGPRTGDGDLDGGAGQPNNHQLAGRWIRSHPLACPSRTLALS